MVMCSLPYIKAGSLLEICDVLKCLLVKSTKAFPGNLCFLTLHNESQF